MRLAEGLKQKITKKIRSANRKSPDFADLRICGFAICGTYLLTSTFAKYSENCSIWRSALSFGMVFL
jgi:hypothetical protein